MGGAFVVPEGLHRVYQSGDHCFKLTEATWGSNKLHFTYDSIGPASVTYNGTTYLYVKNAQGDVVQIVDGNGNTVVTYIYDAWGNMLYSQVLLLML